MKKHIEVLSDLGLNNELKGDRVVFDSQLGIIVYKMGDGFNLQQYDSHHYGGKNCEWVFLNGVRLARTPLGDSSIFNALKDTFLNYDLTEQEEAKIEAFSWVAIASPLVLAQDPEVLDRIDRCISVDLVEFFEGNKWVIGEPFSAMSSEDIHDNQVTTTSTGFKVMIEGVDRMLCVRYSFIEMRPTLHSVFIK